MWEDVHNLLAMCMRDSSICAFWSSWMVLEHFPNGLRWRRYMIYKLPPCSKLPLRIFDILVPLKYRSFAREYTVSSLLLWLLGSYCWWHLPSTTPLATLMKCLHIVGRFIVLFLPLVCLELICVFATTCSSLQGRVRWCRLFPHWLPLFVIRSGFPSHWMKLLFVFFVSVFFDT